MSDLVDLKAALVVALIFIPLERLLPLHAEQSSTRRHWLNDVVYLLFNGILTRLGGTFHARQDAAEIRHR
ncbi:hypothetical protein [Mesorhizobium sp. 128a]